MATFKVKTRLYRQYRLSVREDGCHLFRHANPQAAKANDGGVEIACGVPLKRAREILRDVGALPSGGAR